MTKKTSQKNSPAGEKKWQTSEKKWGASAKNNKPVKKITNLWYNEAN